MPERNIALLEKVMRQITDHPDDHCQDMWWFCGTPSCFFGWAEHFSGLTEEEVEDHSRTGMALLGLTLIEAYTLSNPENSREMLALMVKDLVNGDELLSVQDYRERAHPGRSDLTEGGVPLRLTEFED